MLKRDDLNPNALRAEYAVRGPIVQRAQELEAQGRRVIYCNIGNPQALRQKPLTFLRQLLSLVEYPALLERPEVTTLFPSDVVARARQVLEKHPPGTGAYTQSTGLPFVRQAVADFVARRDGVPADARRVVLTDGASRGIQLVLNALIHGPRTGVMIPVPQYPLYSATIALLGGHQVEYYLDEANRWQLSEAELDRAHAQALARGVKPAALVVINPGNPTGAVLTDTTMAAVVRFAKRHGLCVLADEVYQENVYAPGRKFVSFARVLHDLGETEVTLFSFHSVSKGFLGECGHRGGYFEWRNLADDAAAELVKLQSIALCANLSGQLATFAMVAPPRQGEPSHAMWEAERSAILGALKTKSEILARGVNAIPGMSLDAPEGAMYGFVRLDLPPDPAAERLEPAARAAFEARRDEGYCLALLEETGICVVPGSGFGQRPGTLHFRTTFLPPKDEIESLVERLKAFHLRWTERLRAAAASAP